MHPTAIRLELLPAQLLRLHEEVDPQRVERLRTALEQAQLLYHPPIAALIAPDAAVVLDGATRSTALIQLGAPLLPVQLVDYPGPQVQLHSWSHLLPNCSVRELRDRLHRAGFRLCELSLTEAAEQLRTNALLAYASDSSDRALGILPEEPLPQALRRLVGLYPSGELRRISSEELELLRSHTALPSGSCIVFPAFRPEQIVEWTLAGERLPAGITRHIVAGRVLYANIPLALLFPGTATEDPSTRFRQWWQERLRQQRLRFYPESTFVFDP
jgi:hypothetical protein